MMRTHIASIVLASAVLTAASFLAPFARAATDYLMPKGDHGDQPNGVWPFDPNPSAPGSLTQKVLTYGVDSDGNKVPLKTVRITNNTTQTVYPMMRDPNDAAIAKGSNIGLYDPYDPILKEYRGYIGYVEGGKYYFGLKPGESILVSIPLAFWNGGRFFIETDGEYLVPMTPNGLPNPLNWRSNSHRSITSAENSGHTITNGVVMWYRAEVSEDLKDDTEGQLAEWTIRDHGYLVNPQITKKTHDKIPDTELVTLLNYDVSNVDNLYLPLAMEANDVWVIPQTAGPPPDGNRNGWGPGKDPDVYGWTGAINDETFLQSNIKDFTKDNELLGQYFGTKGWPYYNIPNPNAPRKIPSGANIFAQSPLKGTLGSYGTGDWENAKYMLSSGGTTPTFAPIGASTPDPAGSTILHLSLADPAKIAFLHKGYGVIGHPPEGKKNPIKDGTTIIEPIDKTAGTVTLSQPLVASSEGCVFDFTRPVHDYASDAMIKLWYSWAQYYLTHWKDKMPSAPTETTIHGSIKARAATLTFNDAHPELIEGMAVTGRGLDNAQTEMGKHQGDAVILQIATDKKSVVLSQVVADAYDDQPYTFRAPEKNPLLWTPKAIGDPGYPLIGDKFQFSGEPPSRDPYGFSQKVYLIMASMNQIGEPNNDSVSKYMQDVVGANMGFIFTNDLKARSDADMVTSMIRDMIKSVLRGVTDFTKFPDEIVNGQHTVWYPDPKKATGGQAFNVFNLDPFVWFVHVVLGFSSYGFSVDDDVGNIGAGGASHLQLTVTKTDGLKNTDPWTNQAPYGPVPNPKNNNGLPYLLLDYSGPASQNPPNGATNYKPIKSASNTTPITITTVDAHYLSNGVTVVIDQVQGNTAANGTFTTGNVGTDTFDLYRADGKTPVAGNGTYTGGGRWSYPLHAYVDTGDDLAKVWYRVKGDEPNGTFQGAFVSVNGVDKPPGKDAMMFRVFMLGPEKVDQQTVGRLILSTDLTDESGARLDKGTYKFTFFGVAPTK